MTADEAGQGELFGQRAKRSTMAPPRRPGDQPTSNTPGRRDPRRGAEFVADPATIAEEAKRRQLAEQLEGVALRIGVLKGAKGFAMWHVRDAATEEGILTGSEGRPDPLTERLAFPRALSWLGALLPGLARRGLVEKITIDGRPQYDTSEAGRAHGNKNVLWKITAEGRTAALAAAGYVDFKYWNGEPGVDL